MVDIKRVHLIPDLAQAHTPNPPAQGPSSDTDIAAVTEIAIIPFWLDQPIKIAICIFPFRDMKIRIHKLVTSPPKIRSSIQCLAIAISGNLK